MQVLRVFYDRVAGRVLDVRTRRSEVQEQGFFFFHDMNLRPSVELGPIGRRSWYSTRVHQITRVVGVSRKKKEKKKNPNLSSF